ncbi:integrase, catalytic region, zinc finger, CCHC-type containing protein [Tanacetum coccineum]
MSTSKTYQQSLADAGSETRPPMLERGSYIPWASRFKRFLNRKRENRKWLLKALEDGPYVFRNITPTGSTIPRLQEVEDLQGDDLLYYDAEMELMNMILLSIPNEIYNSVDSCKTAKEMWARVERLMRGTIQNQVDRETRFTNEFDQFVAEPGESLVSVYNRFAQLMNDLERNNMKFPTVSVNTKFLNSLQPEWLKYVTQVRLAKQLTVDSFDDLFDYLSQFEKLVNASRAKKLEKSHDPLALVAHTGSSSRNTSSYYVTHPSSVVDYDEEYEQDDVHNHSEDPLASAMLLLAKAITQNFSNPTNNRLRASSNTRNQAVVQGDRVNIQSRNSGNVGRNNRRAYVQEEVVEGMNATNETANVQRIVRTPTPGNTSTGQCYNCGGKGHYARNCPKPRVRDSKYFMEQMLLAKQDEAGVILTDEQNDFLFADASRMEEIEELSANICLMARIQPADQNSDDEPSYESAFVSEVQSSSINENDEQMYPTHTKIINSTIDDDQINSNIQFDSVKGNVNSGSVEKDTHVYDLCALETLARNAYDEAAKQQRFAQKDNNYLKEFLEADERAKRVQKQAESQLYRDRDIIRDLKKQRDKLSQENSKRASMFYTSKEEIALNDFCRDQVKPLLNELLDYFDGFQNLFQRDIKEMKDAFEQNDVYLDEIWKAKMNLMNCSSSVKRPKSRDSHVKISVLDDSKNEAKKEAVYTLDTTSVASKSKIDEASASKARDKVVQIVLWVVDSGCSKHMTGDRFAMRTRIWKSSWETVLVHNSFSVGQFCDGDLEVAFRSNTCYVRNLEGDDLLTGGRDSNLYTISISDMAASSPICLMSKATSTKSCPMFEDYFEQKSSDTTINSAAQLTPIQKLLHFYSSIYFDELTSRKILADFDGCKQEEGIDFEESFALLLVLRLSGVHDFGCSYEYHYLSNECHKTAFLNGPFCEKKGRSMRTMRFKDDYKSTSGGLQFLGGKARELSLRVPLYSFNPVNILRQSHWTSGIILLRNSLSGVLWKFSLSEHYTNLADLFTNALPKERFEYLVHRIVIIIAQQPHAADVHPDELLSPNKQYDLMDANKEPWQTLCKIFSKCLTIRVTGWDQPPLQIMKMLYCFVNNIHVDYAELMWEGIYYLLHSSVFTLIPIPRFTKRSSSRSKSHPLRFSIAASASVPWIYMAQFWHTLKEDGSKHRLKFLLDRKELTLTLDDFRTIFHLPQANDNNHASFVPPPSFSDMVPFYKQVLGFTMELKTHLAAEEIEKLVENPENVDDSSPPRHDDTSIPGTRLEPRSDKESPEVEIVQEKEEETTKDTKVEPDKDTPMVDVTNIVPPVNVDDEEDEITDEVFELRRRVKGKNVEETRISPIPSPTRSPRNLSTLVSSDTEKLQELTDDPHDDAHPEGENSAKRQKTSEYEAYVSGESSSGQVNVEEPGPFISGNQEQDDEFDFWTDSYASDDDEIPTKQVTQDIMEEISLTIDEAKLKKMADEMLRQRCTSGDEHQYHIDQMKNFLQSDIVWESRKEIQVLRRSFCHFINFQQLSSMMMILKNGLPDGLIRIEEYDVFSIVYEPVHGIIYTNSKKEKRVMRHSEIHKFCDATLRRTLEGLKSYYNDVKYGYVQKELTNDEVEFLKLFEEEIEVRLNYRDQMRRWEMYVNGRPLGPRRKRPE